MFICYMDGGDGGIPFDGEPTHPSDVESSEEVDYSDQIEYLTRWVNIKAKTRLVSRQKIESYTTKPFKRLENLGLIILSVMPILLVF